MHRHLFELLSAHINKCDNWTWNFCHKLVD